MRKLFLGLALAGLMVGPVAAQQKSPFGGFKHDRNAPIEITANALEVRQSQQTAVFTGKVIAGQGTLRLTADRVEVKYDEKAKSDSETGAITNLKAKGDVFLSNGSETAQGSWAEYNLKTGMVRMGGDVVLTQGKNAGRGSSLVVNLNTGVARLSGGKNTRMSMSFVAKQSNAPKQPAACAEARLAAAAKDMKLGEGYALVCVAKQKTN